VLTSLEVDAMIVFNLVQVFRYVAFVVFVVWCSFAGRYNFLNVLGTSSTYTSLPALRNPRFRDF